VAEFEEAQWGIPHCKYERTSEGFKVNYTTPRPFKASTIALGSIGGVVLAIAAIVGGIAIGSSTNSLGVGLFAFFAILCGGFFFGVRGLVGKIHTNIEVTRDAIIIDNKKLRRADFGNFVIARTIGLPGTSGSFAQTTAILGYQYGSQSFEFGGMWGDGQADEFVSALNKKMRVTAAASDERNPSPEALRVARPTDF
jgi:hypothetical protein